MKLSMTRAEREAFLAARALAAVDYRKAHP
jgi:hypothetical protein